MVRVLLNNYYSVLNCLVFLIPQWMMGLFQLNYYLTSSNILDYIIFQWMKVMNLKYYCVLYFKEIKLLKYRKLSKS